MGPDSPYLLEIVKSKYQREFKSVSPADYCKKCPLPLPEYLRLAFESCEENVLVVESIELLADDGQSRMELLRLLVLYCKLPIIAYSCSIDSCKVFKAFFSHVFSTPSVLDGDDLDYLDAREGTSYRQYVRGEEGSLRQAIASKIRSESWSNVGGMGSVKEELMNAAKAVFECAHRDKYSTIGCSPPTGVLLSGPPGTGKTMLSRALATELQVACIACSLGDLLHAFIGESEQAIGKLFADARAASPCIVFLDELDALFSGKGILGVGGKLVAQLIYEMDGLREDPSRRILVIGATNFVDCIDRRLLGRFDVFLRTSFPDASERAEVLETLGIAGNLVEGAVSRSAGMSGAEIAQMVQLARQRAYERHSDCIEMQDFP
jgi:hypothetical protein